jgi:Uma2 family endonuclease
MVLLSELSTLLQLDDPEQQQRIANVTWSQYEALLADYGDRLTFRVNYLDGVLEIVSPSRRHESGKTQIGTLLEIYFLETDTEYFPTGSTTFRDREQRVGAEPDESYCIGTEKPIPDLAIEVVVTSGGVERLERFRRLGVCEVWFWQQEQLFLYQLQDDAAHADRVGYEAIAQSQLLPDLDIKLFSECVRNPNPLAAAKAFRQGIRAQHRG